MNSCRVLSVELATAKMLPTVTGTFVASGLPNSRVKSLVTWAQLVLSVTSSDHTTLKVSDASLRMTNSVVPVGATSQLLGALLGAQGG